MGVTQGSLSAHRFAGLLLQWKSARRAGGFSPRFWQPRRDSPPLGTLAHRSSVL